MPQGPGVVHARSLDWLLHTVTCQAGARDPRPASLGLAPLALFNWVYCMRMCISILYKHVQYERQTMRQCPRKFMAVLAQKGVSTQYWAKVWILMTMWYPTHCYCHTVSGLCLFCFYMWLVRPSFVIFIYFAWLNSRFIQSPFHLQSPVFFKVFTFPVLVNLFNPIAFEFTVVKTYLFWFLHFPWGVSNSCSICFR